MTWVVGASIPFGYGFALSDIRVTLENGQERDCLQKIYPVGRFIAAGFAGSVRIGFAMIDTLSQLLDHPDLTQAWDPVAVSEWWPAYARDVWSKFPPRDQAAHSHLLMVGVSPTENNGDAPWPKAYVYVFRSPEFQAEAIPPGAVGAVGSGNFVEPCRDLVQRLSTDHDAMFQIMKGEQGHSGGMGQMLGWLVTSILKKSRPSGISSHLHWCWVYRGRVVITANDHSTIGPWTALPPGPNLTEESDVPKQEPQGITDERMQVFKMPSIAHSWDELTGILSAEGSTAEGSVAHAAGRDHSPTRRPRSPRE